MRQTSEHDGTVEAGADAQRVPVNMYEAEEAMVIVAPLPGVMPDDITVTVRRGAVRIAAEMRTPAPKEYLRHEWHYGPYEREVDVPPGFGAAAAATFGNGQLAIRLERGEAPAGDGAVVRPKLA